jgi:adenylate kinase
VFFLESINTEVSVMLALDVPKEELVKRLLLRGEKSQRADDQDASIIENRIRVYLEQTAVVASYYEEKNKYQSINGLGSINEITERLYSVIDLI